VKSISVFLSKVRFLPSSSPDANVFFKLSRTDMAPVKKCSGSLIIPYIPPGYISSRGSIPRSSRP